jgi:outer membrane protein assembly factor BamB
MIGVYCYDLSGKLLWSKDLGSYPMQMDWGSGSSPVLHDELVFIQCDNDESSFLVALDKKSGDEVWRVTRDEQSNWATPLIWKNGQRTELVVGGGGKMRSYEPATGKLLWEMAGSGRCSDSPVASDKLLYVDSANRLTGLRGILAAIKPGASGDISLPEESTSSDFVAWSAKLTGHRVASPLVVSDCLYLLEQQAGIIRCLDATTGKEHYRQRLPGATGLTASPWTAGGKVFCLDQSGQTFVLAPGSEFKVLTTNKLADEMFWASPAVARDSLFLRSIDHLYCIR